MRVRGVVSNYVFLSVGTFGWVTFAVGNIRRHLSSLNGPEALSAFLWLLLGVVITVLMLARLFAWASQFLWQLRRIMRVSIMSVIVAGAVCSVILILKPYAGLGVKAAALALYAIPQLFLLLGKSPARHPTLDRPIR